jgi:PAS domain S-box-containing protein
VKPFEQAVLRDSAASKRFEESLRLQSAALEAAANAIVITDQLGNILQVNAAFTALTGYAAREVIGQNPRILKSGQQKETFYRNLWQTISSGRVWSGELTNRRKDGSLYAEEMTITPLRDADGVIAHYIAIKQDISERKRAEDELRWKTAFLEAQVNSSIDGILVVDQDRKTLLQNQRFTDLFKMPQRMADEVSDENRLRWVTDMVKNPEPFVQKVLHLYAHPNEISHDEIELKDGTTLDRYSSPAIGKDGKYYGRIWTFHDITERKTLEARLFQSQKMETVGKLAGGVAHEFNSILTTIIGQGELLLGDLPAGSPLAKNAAEINKAAGRGATLTRQLLAYGRKQFLQPEILNLNRVIEGMEDMFRHLMGVDVETQIIPAPGLRAVKADAGQIEQVIMNMLMNAREAMPNGGKLILETANVSFDQKSVGRYLELKPGDYVMLAITDTGTGMSEEVKARVFEPFFTTRGVGHGTGLGLSTCDGIIKQSGGQISVYSEPARGTTFKIYLPQVEPQANPDRPPVNSQDLPHGTETILLVEDDSVLREMAATLLGRLGYKVLAAANGIEALRLKQQRDTGHVDLLFTDVVMPHMSGKELAERMQALYPHTRVLFTSAHTRNAIIQQGVLNKDAALLLKPFTPAELASKVRELLDQPGAPRPDIAPGGSGFARITHGENTP